jgi:subtilase family serine protease
VNRIAESNENNNKLSVPMSVGIDLTVLGVSWNPASFGPGAPITFSAVVQNVGTVATPAGTIIGVRFDIDGTAVSWSDTDTQSLPPGGMVTLTANYGPNGTSTWSATSGAHTLQAWVDDVNRLNDVNRNNNKFLFPISTGIDLTVTNVTWSPANPAAGQPVTFSATVQNVGSMATPSGTIIGVQFQVDGNEVSWSDTDTTALGPGGVVTLTANSGPSGSSTWTATSGAHAILAWVDDVNRLNDVNRNNNKDTVTLTVP